MASILPLILTRKVFIYIGLPVLVACGGIFYKHYKTIPQDNPIEEVIEVVVKDTTGVDVDLSPNSPENKVTQEDNC
jgi:hypothetical protein